MFWCVDLWPKDRELELFYSRIRPTGVDTPLNWKIWDEFDSIQKVNWHNIIKWPPLFIVGQTWCCYALVPIDKQLIVIYASVGRLSDWIPLDKICQWESYLSTMNSISLFFHLQIFLFLVSRICIYSLSFFYFTCIWNRLLSSMHSFNLDITSLLSCIGYFKIYLILLAKMPK